MLNMDALQNKRLAEWIRTKWKHGPCPVCQENNFGPGADIAFLIPVQGSDSGMQATPPRGPYLFVPILCGNCGYSMLINANLAGLMGPPPIPPPPEGNIYYPPGTEP
jgi:hypothetical protein